MVFSVTKSCPLHFYRGFYDEIEESRQNSSYACKCTHYVGGPNYAETMQRIYYSTSNKTVAENYMIEYSKKQETKNRKLGIMNELKYRNLSTGLYNSFGAGNIIQKANNI